MFFNPICPIKRWRLVKFLMTALILVSWSTKPALLHAESSKFLVLYSNSVHGETEPCG